MFFPGGLGSGNSLRTILPSASTGDSFTVIPGLEGQVTCPLSPTQGEAYDGRYGILRGDLPGRSPAGRFGDLRSLRMFGDPQNVEGDGFEDARDFVPKIGGGVQSKAQQVFAPRKIVYSNFVCSNSSDCVETASAFACAAKDPRWKKIMAARRIMSVWFSDQLNSSPIRFDVFLTSLSNSSSPLEPRKMWGWAAVAS